MAQTHLFDRRFVVVAGKGGVGRTTVAAALARAATRAGRRVLLAQMDSPDRLAALMGQPAPIGPDIVDLGAGLWAVNMTPKRALHDYGLMVLRYEAITNALFENRAVRGFLGAVPGLDAYAMLGKAWWHTTETVDGKPRYDLVVVDGPASGHALKMLTIPRAILDAVPRGPLARDAKAMRELFDDPRRSALLVVTLPEELPARETATLVKEARATLKMPLGPLIVNAVPDPRFADPDLGALLGALAPEPPAGLGNTLAGARLLAERRHEAERVLAVLAINPGLPRVELPRLPVTRLLPEDIDALAARLADALA